MVTIRAIRKMMNGATIQTGIPDIPPGLSKRISRREPPDSASPGSKRI